MKLKAIIVEVDSAGCGGFAGTIQSVGWTCRFGKAPVKPAIEISREVKPDVVLDVELQDMTGFELLRRYRIFVLRRFLQRLTAIMPLRLFRLMPTLFGEAH